MFTIKRAAELTGVAPATLRAWENRYGIGRPTRTSSGYRLYDDRALAEIRRMLELISAGWAPAQAAAESRKPADAAAVGSQNPRELVGRLLGAARALDEQALDAALDAVGLDRDFDGACRDVIMPTLTAIGEEWTAGRFDISSEHLLSHAISRRLSVAFEAAPAPAGPRVLVGLPAGCRHDLAAQAFAVSLRQKRTAVTYLGTDLPVDAWLTALDAQPTAAVAMSVPIAEAVEPATATFQRIKLDFPDKVLAAGGSYAAELPDFVVQLPTDIGDAATGLNATLTNSKKR